MKIPMLAAAFSLSLFAGSVVASPSSNGYCEGVACFSETLPSVDLAMIRDAPKFAWRPGYNNNNRRYGQSSNSKRRSGFTRSWFVSVPRTGPANARGTVVFSPRSLTWAAYDNKGALVKSGRASGGSHYCADVRRPCRTPIGNFSVHTMGPANCVSRKYPLGKGGAKMPHCMYFRGGYALHGSYHVPNYNASHGCIRVQPSAAAWLHRNFVKVGTKIHVKPY